MFSPVPYVTYSRMGSNVALHRVDALEPLSEEGSANDSDPRRNPEDHARKQRKDSPQPGVAFTSEGRLDCYL